MTSDTEYAWVAGFIDGEGHFSAPYNKGKKYAVHMLLQLSISQAQPELLERVKQALGGGSVSRRIPNGHQGVHRYSLSGTRLDEAVEHLWLYLGIHKKRQWNQAVERRNHFYSLSRPERIEAFATRHLK
jgi:hypothetical protein